jgi:hypothetical protein
MPGTQVAPILQIVEVLGPAEQGKSIPFKCMGEDGNMYYVKAQQTNRGSLWREWICAHVARAFGLALPPFGLVQVDEALLAELDPEWRAIGSLPAFGSRQHPGTSWLELGMATLVPAEVQRDVLVFDWWVQNTDRLKGNPNLLWDAEQGSLVVIDHNLALDPDFNAQEFLEHHVFSAQWVGLPDDLVTQAQYARRMVLALPAAVEAIQCAPEEWLWENSEFDLPANFDRDRALEVLSRCENPELWRTV